MANILQPFFYGMNSLEYFGGVQGISLQFHITAECDQSCIVICIIHPIIKARLTIP